MEVRALTGAFAERSLESSVDIPSQPRPPLRPMPAATAHPVIPVNPLSVGLVAPLLNSP